MSRSVRLLAVVVVLAVGCSTAPSPTTQTSLPSATGVPSPAATAASTPTEVPSATPDRSLAVVPVTGFWSATRDISSAEVKAALAGESTDWRVVIGEPQLIGRLAAALGVVPSVAVISGDRAAVAARVASDPHALGLLAADQVGPSVRALAVDGKSLFGVHHVASLVGWPFVVDGPPGTTPWDPAGLWTIVAGGDVMLDREIYRQTVILGKGADLPWDGGTVRIASRRCCNVLGNPLPVAERTGHAGAVRDLLAAADIGLVNLEGPAPDAFHYHATGLVFTFDPALLAGLVHAGVDLVDLANNHIGNGGTSGIVQTVANLDAVKIAHTGAGANLAAARTPANLSGGGIRVAFLGYDNIADPYHATGTRPGNAPLSVAAVRADAAAARAAGATMVIALLHWGIEYRATVATSQRQLATAILAAGVDLIIGSHSHWAGAVEAIGDGLVLYSLGDFIFDIARSEESLEGLLAELTFAGTRLVQVDLHPTLIVDLVQPNLLDPPDAATVLGRVRKASSGLLDW